MKAIKHTVVGICIVVLCSIAPTANAQSTDAVRSQLLRELIVLLQAQLELLLETESEADADYPIADAVFFDDDSFLDDIDADIIARYRISDMDITTPSRDHEQYIDRMADLLPESYHQYFAEFVVFESEQDLVDAFVETTLPYDSQWRYGLNTEVFTDSVSSRLTSELMIHEFAHLFSFHEVFTTTRPTTCHEFFSRSGCVSSDVIYGKFLAEFWDDHMLDEAVEISTARNQLRAIDRFYDSYEDEFVSTYAASSPAEDFAESFAHFVLYDDESFGVVADQKLQFFNRFSSTRAIKEEILSDL